MSIKRIQKTALRIIYQKNYQFYAAACEMARISTLEERRIKLCKMRNFPTASKEMKPLVGQDSRNQCSN